MVASFSTSGTSPLDDLARQALGDGRLADAGIADEQRIVLLAPAQHLDGAQHLRLAADQRVDAAALGLLVEVDAVGVERVLRLLLAPRPSPRSCSSSTPRTCRGSDMPGRLAMPWLMYWTASKRVISCSCRKKAAWLSRSAKMATSTLAPVTSSRPEDCTCTTARWITRWKPVVGWASVDALDEQAGELVVEILGDAARAASSRSTDAGAHDRGGIAVVEQRQQQVLERRVFVMALVGVFERAMQRRFQAL